MPAEVFTKNTPKIQNYTNKPSEDSVVSLLNSYLESNFEVIKKVDNLRYANGNNKVLVYLGPIALISSFKMKTSNGKHLEDISHAHIVSLMYKLLKSTRGSDDLSFGFDRNRNKRRD